MREEANKKEWERLGIGKWESRRMRRKSEEKKGRKGEREQEEFAIKFLSPCHLFTS